MAKKPTLPPKPSIPPPEKPTLDNLSQRMLLYFRENPPPVINEFSETMQVPDYLVPALASGRSELLRLVEPRELTAAEFQVLLNLIGVLIDTNFLLQRHARAVADFTAEIHDGLNEVDRFLAARRAARMLMRYADPEG